MSSYNIVEFRELIRKAKHASDPEIKLALSRIASEAKAKLGGPSIGAGDYFESLRQCLHQLKGNSNADLRIACLLDCANYFYLAGDLLRGVVAAQDGLKLSRQVKDPKQLRKSLTTLGILQADTGSIAQAIESYVEAIGIADQIHDHAGQAGTLLNLGVALLYAGQFEESIGCLRSAEQLIDQIGTSVNYLLPPVLTNQADCLLRLGRVTEGLEVARRSLACSGPPQSASELLSRIIREFNYLQLLLEGNNPQLARECVTSIRECASQLTSARANTLAKLSEGLLETFFGNDRHGLELIEYARSDAKGSATLWQDAMLALVKALQHLGHNEEALDCLEEYLKQVRKTRQEFAVWHVRVGSRYLRKGSPSEHSLSALEQRQAMLRARAAEDRIVTLQVEMLERLAITADLREEASGQHGLRVGRLAAELGQELGWNPRECAALDLAARLHDLGKIGMPDRILLTSDRLKDAERHFMCTHTLIGAEILAKSETSQLRMAEEIALLHHEWWDGNGYPKKLSGKRIPLHARIVAIADVFDALTHGRPYSPPWSIDEALEEIRKRRGTQFDPELTDRFLELIARLRAGHTDLDGFLTGGGRNSPFVQARQKIKLLLERERDLVQRTAVAGNQTRH